MTIKAQGTTVRVSSSEGTAITITGITNATQAVVTATNTLEAGDVVIITGVVGMSELNDRAFIVSAPTGSAFTLRGIDSTNYGTYGSGGSARRQTLVEVLKVRSIDRQPGEAADIDATHLKSLRKEYVRDLADAGNWTFEINTDTDDSGQARMVALEESGDTVAFTVILTNAKACAFAGYVKTVPTSLNTGDIARGTVTAREATPWTGWV